MNKVLLIGSNPDSNNKISGIGEIVNVLLKNPNFDYFLISIGRNII